MDPIGTSYFRCSFDPSSRVLDSWSKRQTKKNYNVPLNLSECRKQPDDPRQTASTVRVTETSEEREPCVWYSDSKLEHYHDIIS